MNAPFKSYLDGAVPIIQANGYGRGKRAWTVLSVYHEPTDALPFQAEIVGDTIVEFQVVRVKRQRFRTLALALAWGAFDRDSPLYQSLREKALEWAESRALPDPLVATFGDDGAMTSIERVPAIQRTGFTAPAGCPLSAAITWLYEDRPHKLELGDPTAVEEFADDFGIDVDFVEFALLYEAGATGDHQQPHPGNLTWIKGFIASLRFFDREAFWANRATG